MDEVEEMRLAPLVIVIGGFEEFRKDALASFDNPRGYNSLYLTPKQMHAIFSEQRLRLLKAISEHPDYGVVRLAGLLSRKQAAVSRDVSFLKGLNVISEEPLAAPTSIKSVKPARQSLSGPSPFAFSIVL
ncbi:MAG: hypothetical protein V1787_02540 [Candidatus Micrarchaeota archaeon]